MSQVMPLSKKRHDCWLVSSRSNPKADRFQRRKPISSGSPRKRENEMQRSVNMKKRPENGYG